MKYIFLLLIITSCTSYEVIQSVGENQYHMYRKGKVEIIESKEKLEIGKSYNIKKVQKK
tara:strand:+ start:147 stop:323 length:177 start_codon:yes stop_codon:yes gene_type:complete